MLGAALIFDQLTNRFQLGPKQIFIGVGGGLALLGIAQAAAMREMVLGPLRALLGRPPKEAA